MEEIWKDIDGYEGYYQVSNLGRIKSFVGWNGKKYIEREKILNPYKQVAGKNYYRSVVKLQKNNVKKDFKVHQLVAKAFIDNPNEYKIINHIDGDPFNNCVENLEWCTQKHNVRHGLENESRIFTIKTIDRETMVDLLNSDKTYDQISEILGISKTTVHNYIKKFKIHKKYF